MRPIIPCHSAVQIPAAKYVSKKLKPIVQSAPTIIHGTKDLAIKLSKLKLDPRRKFYMVTDDIVAFYPSIPIKKYIDITLDLYYKYYNIKVPGDSAEILMETQIFIKALQVGNEKLIFIYNSQMYEQTRGLAMSVADSPDLANLYSWYFEKSLNIHNHPLIPFYGQYIDDVCAIVYATSENEARTIANTVKFDDCIIEWNVSDQYQVFFRHDAIRR